jgi:hypothetical protein
MACDPLADAFLLRRSEISLGKCSRAQAPICVSGFGSDRSLGPSFPPLDSRLSRRACSTYAIRFSNCPYGLLHLTVMLIAQGRGVRFEWARASTSNEDYAVR